MIQDESEFRQGYNAIMFLCALEFSIYLIIKLTDNCLMIFCSDPLMITVFDIMADFILVVFGFMLALLLIANRLMKKMRDQLR